MIFDNDTMSLRHSFQIDRNYSVALDHQPMQFVEVRLGLSSDIVCIDSQEIVQRSPSSLFADTILPFDLRELNTPPFLSKSLLARFLSPFNLSNAFSNVIFNKISAFANQFSHGNLDLNFHIIVSLDFVISLFLHDLADGPTNFIADRSSPSTNNGASPLALRKLMNHKFNEELGITEQHGDCTICSDELIVIYYDGVQKELTKIPCGHVFHQSCIIRWLHMNNSCPLCRAKIQDIN